MKAVPVKPLCNIPRAFTQRQIYSFHSLISYLLPNSFAPLLSFTLCLHSTSNSKFILSAPFFLFPSLPVSCYPEVVTFHFWFLERKLPFASVTTIEVAVVGAFQKA